MSTDGRQPISSRPDRADCRELHDKVACDRMREIADDFVPDEQKLLRETLVVAPDPFGVLDTAAQVAADMRNSRPLSQRLKPLGDRVVVRQDPAKAMTASGRLYIPDTAKEYHSTGTVLAVGPRAESVTKGERVLFKRRAMSCLVPDDYSGTTPDADVLVLRDEDMIAVIGDAVIEVGRVK